MTYRSQMQTFEARILCRVLLVTRGNVAEAARRLEMPHRTIWHRLRALGIEPRDFKVQGDVPPLVLRQDLKSSPS